MTTMMRLMGKSLADRALVVIREEMARRKLGQRDIAGILACSQSRVAKLLNGRIELGVNDLELLCRAVSVQPTEAVRDRGLEFVADLTPTELRVIELFRRLPLLDREAFFRIVRLLPESGDIEPRGATPKRSNVGKPRPR